MGDIPIASRPSVAPTYSKNFDEVKLKEKLHRIGVRANDRCFTAMRGHTMQAMPYDTLDTALNFLKEHPNWFLFPIRRLEKTPPLFKNELELASNDPKQIRKW